MAIMTAEEAAEWGKTLSFEKVWAAFMETDRKMVEAERKYAEARAETRAEIERQIAETRAETERQIAETKKQTAEIREETERQIAETREETERQIAETKRQTAEIREETERQIAETRAETERIMAETERQIAETKRKTAEAERQRAETRAETERLMEENTRKRVETERIMAENARKSTELDKKIDKMVETVDKMGKRVDRVTANVGGLNRSMGELIETLIAARLWEKFPHYGLTRAYQRVPLYDEKSVVKTDIDILLVNTVMCMAVEVKHELNHKEDVDHHVRRMALIRQYPPELVNGKQLLGAMAGGVVDPDVKDYAYKSGFFVLELTGESVHLITPPEGFKPKEW